MDEEASDPAPQNRNEAGRHRGRFVKGASGNPGGRPKGAAEFKQACLERSYKALACLVNEIDTDGPQKIKASEIILAYAVGKPTQAVEHSGPEGGELKIIIQKLGEDEE